MNRKGQISGETVAVAVSVILIVVGVMIWMGANDSGPFYWLRTLMPNFDKPAAVTEIALSGLIKYDVSANNLQYYDGVKFQNFDVKNGEQVLIIGDKAFKYGDVLNEFGFYYLAGRKSDAGIKLTGADASDIAGDLGIANKPGEVSVVATSICGPRCYSGVVASSVGTPQINLGDVEVGVYGKQYTLYVLINSKKIIYETAPFDASSVPINLKKEVGTGKDYADKIWAYASQWASSVISEPIKLNVYDYKNAAVSGSCKSYSFPVSKVKALQGNGFVLTANLAKGTGAGECV
jgi:hypothetical protein